MSEANISKKESPWLNNWLISVLNKIEKRYKIVLLSSLFWGLLAHGMALFNKYSVHDDVYNFFDVGATYSSGRWMLGILLKCYTGFSHHCPFSLPLVNGIVSIILIGASACCLVYIFDIKGYFSCVAVSGIMVTTPVISSLFGYMFTAPHYMVALLFACLGCMLICRKKRWVTTLIGALLISCSIGIYQAYFPTALTILLLFFIKEIHDDSNNIKSLLKSAAKFVVSAIISLVFYLLINRIFLLLMNLSLTTYQNIDSMGQMDIGTFFSRFFSSYRVFFFGSSGVTANIYAPRDGLFYYIFLVFVAFITVIALIQMYKKNIAKGILLTVAVLLIPCAVNSIYIMCEEILVHTLMIYSHVFVFVYLIWMLENIVVEPLKYNRALTVIGLSFVMIFSLAYSNYDNICYLHAEIKQTQAISYFTCMESSIKNTLGYDDAFPVTFINSEDNKDISNISEDLDDFFSIVSTVPYKSYEIGQYETIITDYNWVGFMKLWTGYNPNVILPKDFEELDEVKAMPSYPDYGSIKIIDDTVVVKF